MSTASQLINSKHIGWCEDPSLEYVDTHMHNPQSNTMIRRQPEIALFNESSITGDVKSWCSATIPRYYISRLDQVWDHENVKGAVESSAKHVLALRHPASGDT